MTIASEIDALEMRVSALDLPMAFVLRRAKVSKFAWISWKRDRRNPTKKRWDAIVSTVADLELILSDGIGGVMSKITEYKCDFCAQTAKADGVFGIYWLVDNKTIKVVPPHDAGHHLCHTCYNAFSRHFIDLYEHERLRAESLSDDYRPGPQTGIVEEFTRCLCVMSHSRAGWDYQLSAAQRAQEDREERDALARARDIWSGHPDLHDQLRAAFTAAQPLATMREIESPK